MREIKVQIFSSSALILGISIALHLFVQVQCMSYTCEVPGKFQDPDDEHKYHQCFFLYGSMVYLHNVCPMKTCFNDTLQYCNTQSCSDYVAGPTSYNCATKNVKSYPCKKKGYVADPKDPGYYYNCVEVNGPSGKVWESWCYTCSSTQKTCYNDALQACIPCTGGDGNPKLTYDCKGFNQLSFPCEPHSGKKASGKKSDGEEYIGILANPGDQSAYYECYFRGGKPVADCKSCNKNNHELFDNLVKKCVPQKPAPPPKPKPYGCSTRTLTSYPCTIGGFVADSTDRSIFYQCVKKGSDWESRCYSCSSKQKTCFSNVIQACVPCDYKEGSDHDKETGGGTGVGGSEPSTTTHDCAGYQSYSVPCTQLGNGVHAHPGDTCVYFTCGKKGGKNVAECTSCKKAGEETFNSVTKKCEAPHSHALTVGGKIKPYDCSGYNSKSYPCSKVGYFPHPHDPTVYFSCTQQKNSDGKTEWVSKCSICNPTTKSCFKEDVQRCVNECKTGGETGSYDCAGYQNNVTPETSCDALPKKNQKFFGLYGDRSVYFQCTKIKGKWVRYCFRSWCL